MTYQEFRKMYAWTLKNYPGTYELFNSDFHNFMIGKVTTEKHEKRGGKWTLISTEKDDVTPAYYFNSVDAVPFFRHLGGRESVSCGYCVRGYVPLLISSISPDRTQKTVRKFVLF